MANNLKPNSITITYLSKVSFASLNGSDKDVENINPIKKLTLNNGQEFPYVSSQALRRAFRDKLEELGWKLSEISEASAKKGAPKTMCKPQEYIDDDLFGYMNAEKGEEGAKGHSNVRTSPIRVEALLALDKYQGDLDFGTNFMGKGKKDIQGKDIQPNIFETEIHSGFYRGTILIELDRIGCNEGFEKELNADEKIKRCQGFIDAFQNIWASGRQSRFLADISPKFIVAAYMKTKNPIFLEAVNLINNKQVNVDLLKTVESDYKDFIIESTFAEQKAVLNSGENINNLKDGFDKIKEWIKNYYQGN